MGVDAAMYGLTAKQVVDALRRELDALRISHRKLERKAQRPIRAKLALGEEEKVTLGDIFLTLKVARLNAGDFFAKVTGCGVPLSYLMESLESRGQPTWQRSQRLPIQRIDEAELKGSSGFEEYRSALRDLELLREESPEEAEQGAWLLLDRAGRERNPGACAALQAFLGAGLSRPRAHWLFLGALHILDYELESLVGAKVYWHLARWLLQVEYPREALHLLRQHALPLMHLHGSGDDPTLVYGDLARTAEALGEKDLRLASLEAAARSENPRLEFAALERLARCLGSLGRDSEAARIYGRLLASPLYAQAAPATQALIATSRFAALSRAGSLSAEGARAYEATFSRHKAALDLADRVAMALDVEALMRQRGNQEKAKGLLEAELWTVLGLEDSEAPLRQRFLEACAEAGLQMDARFEVLRRSTGTEAPDAGSPGGRPRKSEKVSLV